MHIHSALVHRSPSRCPFHSVIPDLLGVSNRRGRPSSGYRPFTARTADPGPKAGQATGQQIHPTSVLLAANEASANQPKLLCLMGTCTNLLFTKVFLVTRIYAEHAFGAAAQT